MLSDKAKTLQDILNSQPVAMGKIKKMAKGIKTDHTLGEELWDTKGYPERLLAVLIFDKKLITEDVLVQLIIDLSDNTEVDALRISEWLLANQLTKSKKLVNLLLSYQHHELPILRRLFWYYHARQRWTGKTEFDNTEFLLTHLEADMGNEDPVVQWTMNFCVCWIGLYDVKYRERCIALGEKLGLYIVDKVPKGCAPSYAPDFIRYELEKKGLQ